MSSLLVRKRRCWNFAKRLTGMLAILLAFAIFASPRASAQVVVAGGAGGAFFKFAVPANWNGDLIIWNAGLGEVPIAPFVIDPAAPLAGLSWEQPHFSLAPVQFAQGFALATTTRSQDGWS